MPIHRFQGEDGRVHKFEAPEGMPVEQVFQAFNQLRPDLQGQDRPSDKTQGLPSAATAPVSPENIQAGASLRRIVPEGLGPSLDQGQAAFPKDQNAPTAETASRAPMAGQDISDADLREALGLSVDEFLSIPREQLVAAYNRIPETAAPSEGLPAELPQKGKFYPYKEFQVAKGARPYLETIGGMAAGTVGALAPTPPVPGVKTAVAMYSGAKGFEAGSEIATKIEEAYGIRQPAKTLDEIVERKRAAFTEGMKGEAIGLGVGLLFTGIGKTIKGGLTLSKRILEPLAQRWTKDGAERAAAKLVREITSQGPIFAENAQMVAAIQREIPGLEIFVKNAEISGEELLEKTRHNERILKEYFERKFASKESTNAFFQSLNETASLLQGGVKKTQADLEEAFAALKAAEARTPQELGGLVKDEVISAKLPYGRKLETLRGSVPEYPMSFKHLKDEIFKKLRQQGLSDQEIYALTNLKRSIDTVLKRGETTTNYFGVNKTINAIIGDAKKNTPSAVPLLMEVKQALALDLDEIGRMARSGGMKIFQGKPIAVDYLADELEKNLKKIADLTETASRPDMKKMSAALMKRGVPTSRVVNESSEEFAERISADYTRLISPEIPMKETAKGAVEELEKLQTRNARIRQILSEASPGQDAAAAMNAYNQYASREFFGRFDTPTIKSLGTKKFAEDMPTLFLRPSGADELINAVGQEKAATLAREYLSYDMAEEVLKSGTFDMKAYQRWINKKGRKALLIKYGIEGDFLTVENAVAKALEAQQGALAFEKSIARTVLNADPKKAIKLIAKGDNPVKKAAELMGKVKGNAPAEQGLKRAFGDHVFESAETIFKTASGNPLTLRNKMNALSEKLDPIMFELFKDEPQKVAALKNIREAFELMSRDFRLGAMTKEPYYDIATAVTVSPRLGRTSQSISKVLDMFAIYDDNAVQAFARRSLVDPEYAAVIASKIEVTPLKIKSLMDRLLATEIAADRLGQTLAGVPLWQRAAKRAELIEQQNRPAGLTETDRPY